jgi:mRNA-degrading endonuclease RelE of RelBE toxin-antitoxin system
MRGYRIHFTPEASQWFARLHPEHKRTIRAALDLPRDDPHSGNDLQGELSAFKSLKPKRLRIIYDVEEERRVVRVYYLGPRHDVYDQFRRLLAKLKP